MGTYKDDVGNDLDPVKLMIVEDERLAAEDLASRLRRLGYEIVFIASRGEQAVSAALEHQPDVILMDIQLQDGINGIEASRRIHEEQPTPIIFTTAYGDDDHVDQARNLANPYGFLNKPIDENAVHSMIKISLSRFAKDQAMQLANDLLNFKQDLMLRLINTRSEDEVKNTLFNAIEKSGVFKGGWGYCLNESCDQASVNDHELTSSQWDQVNLACEQVLESADFGTVQLPALQEELGSTITLTKIPLSTKERGIVLGLHFINTYDLDDAALKINQDIAYLLGQQVDRIHAQQAKDTTDARLQESEAKITALIDRSTTGIYLIDDNTRFEYVNDRFCEIAGRERNVLIGLEFTELLGASKDLVLKRYRQRQAGEEVTSDYEIDIVRPNGSVRDVLLSAHAFSGSDGRKHSIGHLLDITEQKQTNLQLRKLSKAVEQGPAMVLITDVNGRIEYVNSRFTEIMGYTLGDALGNNPRMFKSGMLEPALYKELWDTILSGSIWRGELVNASKDGRLLWERASISPIRDGKDQITHFVAVKEDITQLKEQQMEAERAQTLKDVLYRISNAAIAATNLAELYDTIFEAVQEIVPSSNFFMAIHDMETQQLTFPFERDSTEDALPESIPFDPENSLTARTIHECKTIHLAYHEIIRMEQEGSTYIAGVNIPTVWLGVPLAVEGHAFGAIVLQEYDGASMYDEEEVQMLEVAAGQIALALDRQRKNESLQTLALELKDANSLKELLLDVITHDLRNPAGVISAVSDVMEAEEELVELLQSSSQSLMKVIENATVMSKLTLGESIEKEPMDLVAIVKETAREFKSQLSNAGMSLELDLPEHVILNLNQIISEVPKNYISNAIKYAHKGGRIRISIIGPSEAPKLCVEDWGTLIPEQQRDAVFRRSVQLEEGVKRGRGLGLAIVKRIAAEHDAEVGVEPADSGGNCFFLQFS